MKSVSKLEPITLVIKSFEEVGRAIAYMHRHHANALSDGKPLVVSHETHANHVLVFDQKEPWFLHSSYP